MNTVAEDYCRRDKRDVIGYLTVIQKEDKRVNMVDQWCIVFCYGYFEGLKLYAVKIWVNIITEGSNTLYLLIETPINQ